MTAESLMTRAEVQSRATRIAEETGAALRLDEPLAPLVSMRVGGTAAALLQPGDTECLVRSVRRLAEDGVPFLVLGGGSNLLVADEGVDCVVVQSSAAAGQAAWEGDGVRAPGGMALGQLVTEAIRRGLSGLEWAAGLPGSIGGAVVGNAGAFGGDIGASVVEVALMDEKGGVRTHAVREGDFRYRRSFVRPGELVLDVVLKLKPADPEAVREETNRVNRQRAASQPKGGHSSGCIFKNPPAGSAGRLIDECGLKGERVGGAFVSPAHANFILNDGTATASDVIALIRRVRAEVKRKAGVDLDLEVQVWPSRDVVEGDAP